MQLFQQLDAVLYWIVVALEEGGIDLLGKLGQVLEIRDIESERCGVREKHRHIERPRQHEHEEEYLLQNVHSILDDFHDEPYRHQVEEIDHVVGDDVPLFEDEFVIHLVIILG